MCWLVKLYQLEVILGTVVVVVISITHRIGNKCILNVCPKTTQQHKNSNVHDVGVACTVWYIQFHRYYSIYTYNFSPSKTSLAPAYNPPPPPAPHTRTVL